MKIAIIGFNVEGRSTYDYFAAQGGHHLTICDQNPDIQVPEGADAVLGESYLNHLSRFDLIVRSAGIPPNTLLESNPEIIRKISTNVNEFFKASPTKNIVGVTGTKGKGTTSTLITKMLEASGKKVFLGGNIGTPPLNFLPELDEDSWVVLELSSFQLTDLQYSPHIAVCLLMTPEHLNWHSDIEDYINSKSQLFRHQTSDDIAIYYADNETSKRIASTSKGWKQPFMAFPGGHVKNGEVIIDNQIICKTNELKLLGEHNWQNVCAAVTVVWKITQDIDALRSVLTSFSGLPYRIEFRREVNGIRYYNDSFASNVAASLAAAKAVPEKKKVLIIGGFDRGLELDELVEGLKQLGDSLRTVLLIGASGERVANQLKDRGFDNFTLDTPADMTEIVAKASALAQPGDAVILSPGFASFDMFKNFEDRGQKFNEAVAAL